MDKFQPGTVCYHKATNYRCVVIKTSDETVKVRDEKNQEQDYYPQELETEAEINERNANQLGVVNRGNQDRNLGFGY